ncbi:16S rRNA (adenine(1518)-N(6)/adenine(1519)-N(6))-dimethyltransferase RsmA [Suttonella ornithocola]|uniref:Ribosomal RNA small subunit methyltransferase A n=1 Tax=Suttonella ornithocola TaxID=279832 RepID=A0A380MR92_9GAMM|nr:16S rRNA (adenine(1518)-N(6)/adenine(1519)-N(6))-dimethyltransferase RsmA [Suttonella ornithocola]SUO94798.1 Ribosomal RNA small subunit methyltransferase A [Suttonella ornithocola]
MAEIRAAKHLGQHFLTDESVISKMLSAIYPKIGDNILEIGPGLGALTLPVLSQSKIMTAIEYDRRVIPFLAEKAKKIGELNLIEADVLTIAFDKIAKPPVRVIGNLPYNLSSPILFHCLSQRNSIIDMHFMLQREVVERITAAPGNKNYGRLTIMLSQYLESENLFDIPPTAFDPPPKVDSAVVRLIPLKTTRWEIFSSSLFEEIVRVAFGQRRKMLRKSLSNYLDSQALESLEILPTIRPEMLGGEDFAKIANYLWERKNSL